MAWREADEKARALEIELTDKLQAFEQRSGPPVPHELVDAAASLRRDAHEKLRLAIRSIRERPASSDRDQEKGSPAREGRGSHR